MSTQKKVVGFLNKDFSIDLFAEIISNISPGSECVDFERVAFSSGGLSSRLVVSDDGDDARVLGFRAFEVRYRTSADADVKACQVVFKIKPKSEETRQMLTGLLRKMSTVHVRPLHSQQRRTEPR